MVKRNSTMVTVRRYDIVKSDNTIVTVTMVIIRLWQYDGLSPSYFYISLSYRHTVTIVLTRFTIVPSYCHHRTVALHHRTVALHHHTTALHHRTIALSPSHCRASRWRKRNTIQNRYWFTLCWVRCQLKCLITVPDLKQIIYRWFFFKSN